MNELKPDTWNDYFSERDVRPCATCHMIRENMVLKEKAVGWKACAERYQWQATHWQIWQAAVKPGANLAFALRRCIEESGLLTALVVTVVFLAMGGAAVLLSSAIAAIQQVAR